MKDNDEIIRTLENEHPAHFLNPSIICGLGPFGHSILNALNNRLIGVPGLRSLDLLQLVDFFHQKDGTELSKFVPQGRSKINLSDDGGTRSSFSRKIHSKEQEIERFWQTMVQSLLEKASDNGRVASNTLNLFFIGETTELDGSVGGIDLPTMIRTSLKNYIANLNLEIVGLFMLPKGTSERGAEVFAFLKELEFQQRRQLTRTSSPLFDHCFLVSPLNSSGTLDASAVKDLVVEFLLLTLSNSRIAIDELFNHDSGKIATFGVSSLVYPVNEVLKAESRKFSAELIREEILNDKDTALKKNATRFLKENSLDIDGIKKRLQGSHDDRLIDRLQVDPLYFSEIEMENWPDRIASYDSFLENEKTNEVLTEMDQKLIRIFSESRAILKDKIDTMVTTEPNLNKTAWFLGELKDAIRDFHMSAVGKLDQAIKSPPPLGRYYQALSKSIRNLPSPGALISRLTVLAVILFFFTTAFLNIVRQLPKIYFNSDFIPPDPYVGFTVAFMVIVFGYLTYKRSDRLLFGFRNGYLKKVEEKHKNGAEWLLQRDISMFFGNQSTIKFADKEAQTLTGLIEEEMDAVNAFRKKYFDILNDLEKRAFEFPGSKIRRSIADAFDVKLENQYKRGHFFRRDEVSDFLSSDGLIDWRILSKKELSERLLKYVEKGFQNSYISGVQQVITQLNKGPHEFDRVLTDLKNFSAPYLAVTPGLSKPIEMLAISSPSNVSWLEGKDLSSASIIDGVDRNSICYLQLAEIDIEGISSFSTWRQAYEMRRDKSELHCDIDGYFRFGINGQSSGGSI